jgi:hypothetical protein
MSKYSPLQSYLENLPITQREITLTFVKINEIINDRLPYSAHQHRAWWGNERNGDHVEAHAWLNAGWKVETVDQSNCWVRFTRNDSQ